MKLNRGIIFALAALLPAIPAAADTLTGTVHDGSNGNAALPGVTVTIVELSTSRTTDAAGAYDYGTVAPGNYTVRAQLTNYVTQDKAVSIVNTTPPAAPKNLRTR